MSVAVTESTSPSNPRTRSHGRPACLISPEAPHELRESHERQQQHLDVEQQEQGRRRLAEELPRQGRLPQAPRGPGQGAGPDEPERLDAADRAARAVLLARADAQRRDRDGQAADDEHEPGGDPSSSVHDVTFKDPATGLQTTGFVSQVSMARRARPSLSAARPASIPPWSRRCDERSRQSRAGPAGAIGTTADREPTERARRAGQSTSGPGFAQVLRETTSATRTPPPGTSSSAPVAFSGHALQRLERRGNHRRRRGQAAARRGRRPGASKGSRTAVVLIDEKRVRRRRAGAHRRHGGRPRQHEGTRVHEHRFRRDRLTKRPIQAGFRPDPAGAARFVQCVEFAWTLGQLLRPLGRSPERRATSPTRSRPTPTSTNAGPLWGGRTHKDTMSR